MTRRVLIFAALILAVSTGAFAQFSGSGIRVTERDTAQSLPSGLWGSRVTTSGGFDTFTIEHNTSATGNFGTLGTVFQAKNGVVSFPDYSLATGTITSGIWNATAIGLAYGGTNVDLSATGGASQVLKQTSVGGNITVAQLAASDLSNGTTGSGAVVLAGSPTFTTQLTTPKVNLSGSSGQLVFNSGGSSGTLSWSPSASAKTITLPNGTTDFTATGGTSQVVKQTSSGAAFTVARLACADLSDSGTGCTGVTATFTGSVTANQIVVATANNVLGSTASVSAASGGTGLTTYAVGDLIYASATTPTLSKLADVGAGSYLRSGGVNTAPLWSTLIIPNSATVSRIPYATSTNTWGESSSLNFDGTEFSLGTALNLSIQFLTGGSFTPSAGAGTLFRIGSTINGNAGQNMFAEEIFATLVEASSGTSALEALLYFNSAVTPGTGTATDFADIYIPTIAAASGTVTASSINATAPSGATNNYVLNTSGRIIHTNMTVEGSTKDSVCRDSSTGELLYNSGVSTCLVSTRRVKHDIVDMEWAVGVKTDTTDGTIGTDHVALSGIANSAKTNFVSQASWAQSATDLINKLHPVNFFYNGANDNVNNRMQQFGFIAEEVLDVEPRLVRFETDSVTPRAVEYLGLIPIIVKAQQEYEAHIERLEQEVVDLKIQLGAK